MLLDFTSQWTVETFSHQNLSEQSALIGTLEIHEKFLSCDFEPRAITDVEMECKINRLNISRIFVSSNNTAERTFLKVFVIEKVYFTTHRVDSMDYVELITRKG